MRKISSSETLIFNCFLKAFLSCFEQILEIPWKWHKFRLTISNLSHLSNSGQTANAPVLIHLVTFAFFDLCIIDFGCWFPASKALFYQLSIYFPHFSPKSIQNSAFALYSRLVWFGSFIFLYFLHIFLYFRLCHSFQSFSHFNSI